MVSWLVSHLLVSLLALALTFVPLFNLLGFEFAVTMGAVLTYVAGWRACATAARGREVWVPARRGRLSDYPGPALVQSVLENLSLVLGPLAIISLNSFRVPTCNWSEGLVFYALFTLPGILYGTTLGFAFGLRVSARMARVLFVTWSLATYAYAAWNVVREPPIFAFNAFIAFFPGPVYDRAIPITAAMWIARATVLLEALLFALLPLVLWDGRRLSLRALFEAWNGVRAVVTLALVLVATGLVFLGTHASALGIRVDRATIQETLGGHIRSEHFDIYYDTSAYAPERANELAREHEFHYAELREFFGHEPPVRIGSYVYASSAQKKRLMGAAGTSFEDALNFEFHINASPFPHPVLRHEMAHIFTAFIDKFWRVCPKIGIHEGIAVAAEWRGESARLGLTPDEACVAMQELGVLPDLEKILGAFGFWTQAGSRAYTVAGAFIHYLVETRGMERFRRLWSSRDFEAAYGRSLESLIDAWRRQRLEHIELTPMQLRRAERRYRPPAVFSIPCAHEQARLGSEAASALHRNQPARAESLYARLVHVEPRNHGHQLSLARASIRTGRHESARALLVDFLDLPEISDSERGRAYDLLGDALWNLGLVAEAETSYAQALELATSHDEARALEIAIAALQDQALQAPLCDYLTGSLPDAAGLAILAQTRALQPEAALPRYLLGRRLYFVGRFDAALDELEPLWDSQELPREARLAALELAALAQLRSGRAALADSALARTAGVDLVPAWQVRFEEVRRRAAWAAQPVAAR